MLLPLALAAALHATMPADSLAGPWRITGDVAGNPLDVTCTFRQTGTALSGRCVSPQSGTNDLTGQLKDGKLTFQHGGDYNGQALTILYSGTFESAGRVKGTLLVQPFDASGTFSAVPVPPKP